MGAEGFATRHYPSHAIEAVLYRLKFNDVFYAQTCARMFWEDKVRFWETNSPDAPTLTLRIKKAAV